MFCRLEALLMTFHVRNSSSISSRSRGEKRREARRKKIQNPKPVRREIRRATENTENHFLIMNSWFVPKTKKKTLSSFSSLTRHFIYLICWFFLGSARLEFFTFFEYDLMRQFLLSAFWLRRIRTAIWRIVARKKFPLWSSVRCRRDNGSKGSIPTRFSWRSKRSLTKRKTQSGNCLIAFKLITFCAYERH